MQSYQSVSIVLGIVGIILGIFSSIAIGWLAIWVVIVSFIGIVLPLANTKHHEKVGGILIVLGILGNLLLIIPGIMAYRWKPESQSGIRPQSEEEMARVKGIADGEREKISRIRRDKSSLGRAEVSYAIA